MDHCLPAQDSLMTLHTFRRIQLSDQFSSEGVNASDFNHDGKRFLSSSQLKDKKPHPENP